ncbi:hypothetical protein [Salinicola endophyticus]|uniref:hypothetical protein n=1 Tax=Salinicola endophyticus TaxID=1949083 RepID=UPI0013009074|nr:hypothetical protein [Salinicola endophyticus]
MSFQSRAPLDRLHADGSGALKVAPADTNSSLAQLSDDAARDDGVGDDAKVS